jgi:hypothetical protein
MGVGMWALGYDRPYTHLWSRLEEYLATGIEDDEETIPSDYALLQNYPNPFNPSTQISFSLPEPGFVSLKVYDLLGREAAVLIERDMSPGKHTVSFDGREFSSGMYFYVLKSGDFYETRKMLLLQ